MKFELLCWKIRLILTRSQSMLTLFATYWNPSPCIPLLDSYHSTLTEVLSFNSESNWNSTDSPEANWIHLPYTFDQSNHNKTSKFQIELAPITLKRTVLKLNSAYLRSFELNCGPLTKLGRCIIFQTVLGWLTIFWIKISWFTIYRIEFGWLIIFRTELSQLTIVWTELRYPNRTVFISCS